MKSKTALTACIAACLLLCVAAGAQTPLDTLLAKYPAESSAAMNALSLELSQLGPGAVAELSGRLVPMGTADDNAERLALSGLAKYAGAPGNESVRAMLASALCEALPKAGGPDVQAFLMSLLQWVGQDDAVPALAAHLSESALLEPATQALAAIATPAACDALGAALEGADGDAAVTLINALGAADCNGSMKLLRIRADDAEPEVKTAALCALAALGDASLAKTLKASGTAPQEQADIALRLAQQLAERGKPRKAERIARDVLRQATTPVGRIAALHVLARAGGGRALKDCMAAVEDEDRDVRCAAIRIAAGLEVKKAEAALVKALSTENPAARADLLRILGEMHVQAARGAAEADLAHPELEVRLAAIDAMVDLAGVDAFDALFQRREIDGSADDPEAHALNAALDAIMPPPGPPLGPPDAEGFVPLFNGRDFSGWMGDLAGYAVEDGLLLCKTGRKIYTLDEYGDFVLRLEFRLAAESNNGIGIRIAPGTHAATKAMEIQLLDDTAAKYADLKPYQYCGAIYGVAAPERGHLKPLGEWNEIEVAANGPQVTVTLNGAVIVNANIAEIAAAGTPDEKEHPGLDRKDGRIAFLGHQTEIAFRNIRVKPLAEVEE